MFLSYPPSLFLMFWSLVYIILDFSIIVVINFFSVLSLSLYSIYLSSYILSFSSRSISFPMDLFSKSCIPFSLPTCYFFWEIMRNSEKWRNFLHSLLLQSLSNLPTRILPVLCSLFFFSSVCRFVYLFISPLFCHSWSSAVVSMAFYELVNLDSHERILENIGCN